MLHCLLHWCHQWEPVRCSMVLSAQTAVRLHTHEAHPHTRTESEKIDYAPTAFWQQSPYPALLPLPTWGAEAWRCRRNSGSLLRCGQALWSRRARWRQSERWH